MRGSVTASRFLVWATAAAGVRVCHSPQRGHIVWDPCGAPTWEWRKRVDSLHLEVRREAWIWHRDFKVTILWKGFPDSSVGKESTCSAEDPGLIPGSGRPAGEGIGYPLQYSWASLVAQLVKNPPEMWDTWVQSLGWEDPLEKEKATHSSILAWRVLWTV